MNFFSLPTKMLLAISILAACDHMGDLEITKGPEGAPQAISLKGKYNTGNEGGISNSTFQQYFETVAAQTPLHQPIPVNFDASLGGVSSVGQNMAQYIEGQSRPVIFNLNGITASTAARFYTTAGGNVTRSFNIGGILHLHPPYIRAKNLGIDSNGYFTPEVFENSMHYLDDPNLMEIPATLDNGDEVIVPRGIFIENADLIKTSMKSYTEHLEIVSGGRLSQEEWDLVVRNGTAGGSAPARGFVIRNGNAAAFFGLADLANGEPVVAENAAIAGKKLCNELRNNIEEQIRICQM